MDVTNNHHKPPLCFWRVKVRTKGHLAHWLHDYFGELSITHEEDGSSLLSGEVPDMSAVYGLILQLRDSGLFLTSIQVEKNIAK